MQPIRKKEASVSRCRRSLILFSAALACLAIMAAALLLRVPQAANIADQPAIDLNIYQRDVTGLTSVTITPAEGEPYTLNYDGETLKLSGDPDFPIRSYIVDELLSLAAGLEADSVITDGAAVSGTHLSQYGLSPAVCQASFVYAGGETLTVSIGDALPIENPRYYCAVSGVPRVYSVTEDIKTAVNVRFQQLHTLEQPGIQSDLIDRITIGGDIDFEAVRTADGWQAVRPIVYHIDPSAMDRFLNKLDSLRFSTWIGDADQLELRAYGLDQPQKLLTLEFAPSVLTVPDEEGNEFTFDIPESNLEIALGAPYTDTSFYTLYNGQVQTGTILSFGFLSDFSLNTLLLKNPVSFAANNLSRLTYQADGAEADYQIRLVERVLANNELETDEYGSILYDIAVYRDGEAIDPDTFLTFYQALTQLTVSALLPDDYQLPDEPDALLTLTNEAGDVTRTVAYYPLDRVQEAVAIDGVALFSMDADWRRLIPALP